MKREIKLFFILLFIVNFLFAQNDYEKFPELKWNIAYKTVGFNEIEMTIKTKIEGEWMIMKEKNDIVPLEIKFTKIDSSIIDKVEINQLKGKVIKLEKFKDWGKNVEMTTGDVEFRVLIKFKAKPQKKKISASILYWLLTEWKAIPPNEQAFDLIIE